MTTYNEFINTATGSKDIIQLGSLAQTLYGQPIKRTITSGYTFSGPPSQAPPFTWDPLYNCIGSVFGQFEARNGSLITVAVGVFFDETGHGARGVPPHLNIQAAIFNVSGQPIGSPFKKFQTHFVPDLSSLMWIGRDEYKQIQYQIAFSLGSETIVATPAWSV